MKKSENKIAFVGNGKLTKSLIKGFLKAGLLAEEMIVIGRENSDLSFFEKLGVKTSREIVLIKEYHLIMLMVTPKGIVDQLNRMAPVIQTMMIKKNPELYFGVNPLLLSMSSGTNIEKFSKILKLHPGCILKATANTNVEYGRGVVRIAGIHDGVYTGIFDPRFKVMGMLKPLGAVSCVSSKEVDRSITSVGSMNAIDARALELMIRNEVGKEYLNEHEILTELHLIKLAIAGEMNYSLLNEYIQTKTLILERLGYTPEKATCLAKITLKSTFESFIQIPGLDNDSFTKFISNVATKGGCTEQGIDKMNTIECLTNPENLWDVVKPIFRKTKKFPKEAFGAPNK